MGEIQDDKDLEALVEEQDKAETAENENSDDEAEGAELDKRRSKATGFLIELS